ncbi:MAG: bifunctional alpha,alpha-trehalose-phosphate synthase (UDP-forming)/trehalose-phosphatase [Methanospirillaceae archaeon]|nr:bifunctional alpha,alpha-trehalose-phosphate synthase (UDP-forming)/trehalose-phosphatase [Methanospirillaceae archaeon]
MLSMNRLIIVSNRLPITIKKEENSIIVQESIGGLATGLGSIYQTYTSLWIGWPGLVTREIEQGDEKIIREQLQKVHCKPVYLTKEEYEGYYNGFCNQAVWPLFHYFYQYASYNPDLWNVYADVNSNFCNVVCATYKTGDIIWIHDYHLMLLPQMIRKEIPDATIGFFLHIPFPPFELFRLIPWRREILSGLVGADLIGFHTIDYVQYFLATTRKILGYDSEKLKIQLPDRFLQVDTFPMGIDYNRFATLSDTPAVHDEIQQIRNDVHDRKIILSIDRLDYTKGVSLRLHAFEAFLTAHPELHEQVTFILVAVPSRIHIDHYAELKQEVDYLVGRINGIFGTLSWTPVRYMFTYLPFERLLAIYKTADIALITPVRDGMNLMAKEYLATKKNEDGFLVLSEFAGAAKELGEALLVNPNDIQEFSTAIYDALMIPKEEKKERIRIMQDRLKRYDLARWTSDFLHVLFCVKQEQELLSSTRIDAFKMQEIVTRFHHASARLLFLDYDGTLVALAQTPQAAQPDKELFSLLELLVQDPANHIVIISGRDKALLTSWFGSYRIGLVAEHGVWLKKPRKNWELNKKANGDWKEEIRPILEVYTDRTPGSFIEEKDYSLAWHYRKADTALAGIRVIELREDLLMRTTNLNLTILEGHKVLEIKNVDINKGVVVRHWMQDRPCEFVLAIGDDRTDEDVFTALPPEAVTIKVGSQPSVATYSVLSTDVVRTLLTAMASHQSSKAD